MVFGFLKLHFAFFFFYLFILEKMPINACINVSLLKGDLTVKFFQFRSSSNSGILGSTFQRLNITYDPLQTVLMVRWLKDTFEFNQPHKQPEGKIQVTGKISRNNKDCVTAGMLRKVILCKQKKRRWPTRDLPLANLTNGTARGSFAIKNIKYC